nr:hypothetical protein [Tanacetum cinerariifolium]
QVAQKKLEEKQIEEERAAKAKYWKLPICYDDDDDEERFDSLDDNIISGLPSFSAITPNEPVLSTKEPDNSLKLDEFIKSGVETLIPIPSESEGIPEHVCDVPSHDNSPPLDVSKIKLRISPTLNANPTPSSDYKTKSFSTSLNSLLEETNTFDNSLPEFETFCFDVEEISSGSTTLPPDISLPEYEAFYDDHVKEISSGNPTTHSNSSLYASFMPDISHRCGTVKKFNTHRSHLNICPMLIHRQNNPPLDVLLFHFYPS